GSKAASINKKADRRARNYGYRPARERPRSIGYGDRHAEERRSGSEIESGPTERHQTTGDAEVGIGRCRDNRPAKRHQWNQREGIERSDNAFHHTVDPGADAYWNVNCFGRPGVRSHKARN